MVSFSQTEFSFQAIVDATPSALILVNHDGTITYVNQEAERMFGYARSELKHRKVEVLMPERYRFFHPQFREMFVEAPSARRMGAGRELFALRKDGVEFPVEIGLNPMVTDAGSMVLVCIIDITERKRAEEMFRLVVESAPNAMILSNAGGYISMVNQRAEDLFGYDRTELIGRRIETLIPRRHRESHSTLRESFHHESNARQMGEGRDLFALKKDGTEFPVEIGLNPIETPEGKMVLASVVDITQRKRHEALLKLELRNRELEQFNYIASHDLQEPLRTISNYIEILTEDFDGQLDSQVLEHLHTIGAATVRMRTLVSSLLDFSRLGKDRKLMLVDTGAIVSQVLSDLEILIRKTNARVRVWELPILTAYETELRQLFQNLIVNAIKFRRPEGLPLIDIRSREVKGHYEFSITDNGIGIEPKYHDRIFQIFQRLNKEVDYEGYGIGLANCKKITDMHSGNIWVDSIPGKGSTFKFTIPIQLV